MLRYWRWMVVSLGMWWLCASATAVREVSLYQALQASALVFQGRVVDREVVTDAPRPFTRIHFEVEEVIKGDWPQSQLTLDFAGAPEVGLVVMAMRYPRVGEEGIYFVETLQKRLANPLYGWSQGYFRIERRGNRAVVLTADGAPVQGLSVSQADAARLSRGRAKGVLVQRQSLQAPMTPGDFKAVLRRWLETPHD